MFNKILKTTLLVSGLAFAQASFATTFDFAKYADEIYGEQGYSVDEPFIHTEDGLSVVAMGFAFDPYFENDVPFADAYAYLDSGNAGLGVCKVVDKNGQCAPSSDDNVSFGEGLVLVFGRDENQVDVTINNIVFRNLDHGTEFGADDTFWVISASEYGVPSFTEYSLTHEFTTPLTGSSFVFFTQQENTQFYISSIDVSEVPAPAPLALLAIGLLGIYSTTRKNKAV